MKHLPLFLSGLFVALSIHRIGVIMSEVYGSDWTGWLFASALGAGVGVSGWVLRFKETKAAGIFGLVICLPTDAYYNLLQVTRALSSRPLVYAGADFLGMGPERLTHALQYGGLVFGVFQGIAAAVFAWQAAGIERVPMLRARAFLPKLSAHILRWFDALFPVQESRKTYASDSAASPNGFTGKHAQKTRKTCACGCGMTFYGRADKMYLDNTHRMRAVRAQGK